MGTEALVEVHTPNECAHALECGAMLLLVNQWDRADGQWHPSQARGGGGSARTRLSVDCHALFGCARRQVP
jgi:hypothetical protein